MATTNYVRLFLKGWKTISVASCLGLILALGFSFAQPLRYSSTVRLLITQADSAGLDPYTAIKSAERIGQNLSAIVYTSSFFDSVMAKGQVDASYFPSDEISRRTKWQDSVDTSVDTGTGVMSVVGYHTDRAQAQALAMGVAEQIVAITPNYFGTAVKAQIIDEAVPSRFFAKPDLLKNAALGIVIGFLLGTAWVLGRVKRI